MSLCVNIKKKLGKFTLDVKLETDGGVLGILGASGCGKSMTLKCIAGIARPDSGKIELDGVTLFDSERGINLPPQRRRIGYLFQSYALFPNMTVRQNILCGLHNEKDRQSRDRALGEMLELLQLEGLEKRRPHQLSGGQQQRVALARILVGDPGLMMLDEPFSALDTHLRGHLQVQMLSLLRRIGKASLLVTHDRNEAFRLCGRIALLSDGGVIALKDTRELFADPGSRQAALLTGCKNIAEARKTGEYEVEVPDWGLRLISGRPVGDGLRAVAVRAHYFSERAEQNRFPVRFTGEIEEPFEYLMQFRFEAQADDAPDLWWRIPKESRSGGTPAEIGIMPDNVLLLYQ